VDSFLATESPIALAVSALPSSNLPHKFLCMGECIPCSCLASSYNFNLNSWTRVDIFCIGHAV
jgi:hypothetical protein